MWLLLSMVSFLICAIVASTNNDDSTVADVIGLGNENNDITTEIHTGRLSKDTWKTWKKESFKERRSGKEIDPNIFLTGEIYLLFYYNFDFLKNLFFSFFFFYIILYILIILIYNLYILNNMIHVNLDELYR